MMLLTRMSDLPSLCNLVRASKVQRETYIGRHQEVLSHVLQNSFPLEIQKIASTVMQLMNKLPAMPCPIETFLETYISFDNLAPLIPTHKNPVQVL